MKKHKIPIGTLIGKNNRKILLILCLIVIICIILYKFLSNWQNILKGIVIVSIIVIIMYSIFCYIRFHKLTSNEKSYKQDIIWHKATPQEMIFIKTYYLAKNKILTNQFIVISIIIFILELIMIQHLKTIITITTITLLISFVIFQTYMRIWQNIDTSAECTYIPIYEKYNIDNTFYTVIILDEKKYIYRLDNQKNCCDHVMIINYKGLSCAINSKTLPY